MRGMPPADYFRPLLSRQMLSSPSVPPHGSASIEQDSSSDSSDISVCNLSGYFSSSLPLPAGEKHSVEEIHLEEQFARILASKDVQANHSAEMQNARRHILAYALAHCCGTIAPDGSREKPTMKMAIRMLDHLREADFPALLTQKDVGGVPPITRERLWRLALSLAATSTGRQILYAACPSIALADDSFQSFLAVASRLFHVFPLRSATPENWLRDMEAALTKIESRSGAHPRERAGYTAIREALETFQLMYKHAKRPQHTEASTLRRIKRLKSGLHNEERQKAIQLLDKAPQYTARVTKKRSRPAGCISWIRKHLTPQRNKNPLGQLVKFSPHKHLPSPPTHDSNQDQADSLEQTIMRLNTGSKVCLYSGGTINISSKPISAVLIRKLSAGYMRGSIEVGPSFGETGFVSLHHTGSELQYRIAKESSIYIPLINIQLRLPFDYFGSTVALGLTPGVNGGLELKNTNQDCVVVRYRARNGIQISEDDKQDFLAMIRYLQTRERQQHQRTDSATADLIDELEEAFPVQVGMDCGERNEFDASAGLGLWKGVDLSLGHGMGLAIGPRFGLDLRHHREWRSHVEAGDQRHAGRGSASRTSLAWNAEVNMTALYGSGSPYYRILGSLGRILRHRQLLRPNGQDKEATLVEEDLRIVSGHVEHTFDDRDAFRSAVVAPIEMAVANGELSRAWADRKIHEIDRHIQECLSENRSANAYRIASALTQEALAQLNVYRDLAWYAAGSRNDRMVDLCKRQVDTLLASSGAWDMSILGPLQQTRLANASLFYATLPIIPKRSSGVTLEYRLGETHPIVNINREHHLERMEGTLSDEETRDSLTQLSTREFSARRHSSGLPVLPPFGKDIPQAQWARQPLPRRSRSAPHKPQASELPLHASMRFKSR